MREEFTKTLGRWLAGGLAILALAAALLFGIQKADEGIAEAIPEFPDIPCAADVIDTIKEPEPFDDIEGGIPETAANNAEAVRGGSSTVLVTPAWTSFESVRGSESELSSPYDGNPCDRTGLRSLSR